MTPTDIQRLRALAEKATPGPWHAMIHDGKLLIGTNTNKDGTYYAIAYDIGGKRKGPDFKDRSEEIANHQLIANLDPATVIALCDKALHPEPAQAQVSVVTDEMFQLAAKCIAEHGSLLDAIEAALGIDPSALLSAPLPDGRS